MKRKEGTLWCGEESSASKKSSDKDCAIAWAMDGQLTRDLTPSARGMKERCRDALKEGEVIVLSGWQLLEM